MGRQICFSSSHSGLTPVRVGGGARATASNTGAVIASLKTQERFESTRDSPGGFRGSRSGIFEVDQTLAIISVDLKLSDVEITRRLFDIAIRFLHLPLK